MTATKSPMDLTSAEKRLLGLLVSSGPLSYSEMRYGFGNRSWVRVFRRLEIKKLAWFDSTPDAIASAKHYRHVSGLQPSVLN